MAKKFSRNKIIMRKIIYFLSLMCVLSLSIMAQGVDGIKGNLAAGEVSAINAAENKISLKTKDGNIDAILSSKTVFKRIPPENPTLAAAVASTLTEISIGDKVMVTGLVAEDKKTLPAKTVYLMTKSDISKKQTDEQEKWKTRGVSGKVTAVNAQTKEITIGIRGFAGEKPLILTPNEKAIYRRYAEDSVKFSDAKIGNFNEIKVGDQLRAVGNKSEDGLKMTAEEFLTGSFRMVGGKITAIDVAKKEITIKDTQTNKPLVIVVNDGVLLKKFPAEMAQMMAMRMGGGAPQGGNVTVRPPNTGQPPTPMTPPTGGTPRPNGQAGGRGEFDDLLNNFPNISLADLKIGDSIAASSAANATQNRVTAIKLVSGVEAFLNAPQTQTGGRGQGGGSGFSIPGLDGGLGF
jgi:hypothetical protein